MSSEEGLRILRKWKRQRTVLSFFFDLGSWSARISEATAALLVVEMEDSPADTRSFGLKGARFDKADTADDVPEDLPLPPELLATLRSFLFVRLSDGNAVLFAEPIPVN